jgi:hypothetical protein
MWKRLISRHLVICGLVTNAAVLAMPLSSDYGRAASFGQAPGSGRAVQGPLDGVALTAVDPAEPATTNAALLRLPAGVWHKIRVEDGFRRQAHGGAAFDTRRGRLVLFGSDTHSEDWDNSVRFFDVAALRWSQAYPADGPSSYRVNADGIPVAGTGVERPWAMHTFDAVEYDPVQDRLIVASYPKHMSPRKSWGVDEGLWRQIKRHPTWTYSLADGRWTALPGAAEHFFPHAAAFDTRRNRFVGIRSDGYYTLSGTPPAWNRIASGTPDGWHTAATYDSDRDAIVLFGNNKRADSVWQYRFGEEHGIEMPTPGTRPPGGASVPLVYHPGVRRAVALVVDRAGDVTETWLYATAEDRWLRVESADLPFNIRMNYQMVYDPRHDLLWLVANAPGDPVAVWALRL